MSTTQLPLVMSTVAEEANRRGLCRPTSAEEARHRLILKSVLRNRGVAYGPEDVYDTARLEALAGAR